jgi:prephenate dehydrogenase
VASGDLTMMMDIMAANRTNITRSLDKALRHLEALRQSVANGDEEILRDLCSNARERRLKLFQDPTEVQAGKVSHA